MRPWPYYNCLIWVGGTIPFWWGSSSRLGTQISSASPPDQPGNRASRSYILTGLLQTSTFLPPDQPGNRAQRSYPYRHLTNLDLRKNRGKAKERRIIQTLSLVGTFQFPRKLPASKVQGHRLCWFGGIWKRKNNLKDQGHVSQHPVLKSAIVSLLSCPEVYYCLSFVLSSILPLAVFCPVLKSTIVFFCTVLKITIDFLLSCPEVYHCLSFVLSSRLPLTVFCPVLKSTIVFLLSCQEFCHCPILLCLIQSCPCISNPVVSIQSCPPLSNPVMSNPILSSPFQSCYV